MLVQSDYPSATPQSPRSKPSKKTYAPPPPLVPLCTNRIVFTIAAHKSHVMLEEVLPSAPIVSAVPYETTVINSAEFSLGHRVKSHLQHSDCSPVSPSPHRLGAPTRTTNAT